MSSLHEQTQENKKTRLGSRVRKQKKPYLESIVTTTMVVDGKKVTSFGTVRVVQSKVVG